MADPITLTIDGQSVTVPPGTLLIEAAKQAGIEIPSFCYYPGLALQGACRMCLVGIEKMPKLQTACTTVVGNGMVVHTQNEEVKNARKAMLEFLLTNHPLDCPVCDKGGECELQDAVFRYGASETRFMEKKLHHEEKRFSNLVYYDWPRCILCYRCIRVCDEVIDVNALGIGFRGAHSEIIPNNGDKLECEECGMCIDICPVGALTSGTYRYKTRPWEVTYTGAICNHCGDGCKTTLSVRNNVVIRANNRDHSGINGEFLCVKGRFGWDFVNSEQRLKAPRLRRNGQQKESSWEEALTQTAERIQATLKAHGPGSVAVIGSNRTTNEENYLLQLFARTVLGTNHIDHHRTADFASLTGALTQAGAAERLASLGDISNASSFLVIGSDMTHQHPLAAAEIRKAVKQRGAHLYLLDHLETKMERHAVFTARLTGPHEATVIGSLEAGGVPEAGWFVDGAQAAVLQQKLAGEKDTVILFGDAIRGSAVASLVKWALTLPGTTRFAALGDYANSRGAADMGLLPGLLPGYQAVANPESRERFEKLWGKPLPAAPGRNIRAILEGAQSGEIKALFVFGSNPVKTFQLEAAALGKLEFLFVAELFETETTALADVVVPAASFAEKMGTVTNTYGQVQAVKKTMRLAETRSDLEILLALARQLGAGWTCKNADDVLREIIAHVPGYAISFPNLLLGKAITVRPQGETPALESDDLVFSAKDTLFTSGSLSRHSWALNSVPESKQPYGHIF